MQGRLDYIKRGIFNKLRWHRVPTKHIKDVDAKGNWNWMDVIKIKYIKRQSRGKHRYSTSYIKFRALIPIDARVFAMNLAIPWLATDDNPPARDAYWDPSNRKKFENHVNLVEQQDVIILQKNDRFIETKNVGGEYLSDILANAARTGDYQKIAEYSQRYGTLLRGFHDKGWSFCDPNPFDVIWNKRKSKYILTDGDFVRKRSGYSSDFKRSLELFFNYLTVAKIFAFTVYKKPILKDNLKTYCRLYIKNLLYGYGEVSGFKELCLSKKNRNIAYIFWKLANYFTRHFRSFRKSGYGFKQAYQALEEFLHSEA